MKLLISSTDLDDLQRVVKRLVSACIPCAVCKDPDSSHLSVWIQQDLDFPLALRVVMNREERARVPHWARALEPALPTNERPATWTGTACVKNPGGVAQGTRTPSPASWPLPSASTASDSPVDDVELVGPVKYQWDQGVPIDWAVAKLGR